MCPLSTTLEVLPIKGSKIKENKKLILNVAVLSASTVACLDR